MEVCHRISWKLRFCAGSRNSWKNTLEVIL